MRFVNRLVAALLAIALVVVGLVLAIEVVAFLLGLSPVIVQWPAAYTWASSTSWDDTTLRLILLAAAVLGLLLLVAELRRAPARRLAVADQPEAVDMAYTRRGVANAVRLAVREVDGVRSVATTIGRRKLRVTAVASASDPDLARGLTDAVTQATQRRVHDLALDPAPRIVVAMKARRA